MYIYMYMFIYVFFLRVIVRHTYLLFPHKLKLRENWSPYAPWIYNCISGNLARQTVTANEETIEGYHSIHLYSVTSIRSTEWSKKRSKSTKGTAYHLCPGHLPPPRLLGCRGHVACVGFRNPGEDWLAEGPKLLKLVCCMLGRLPQPMAIKRVTRKK